MPVLLLGAGVIVVAFLVMRKKATVTPMPGGGAGTAGSGGLFTSTGALTTKNTVGAENTLEASIANTLASTTTQRGFSAGKITNAGSAIDAAASVGGTAFHDEVAGGVFTYGIAIAVGLAAVNVFVAVAVAYVAVFIALATEEIDFFTDMARRDMDKGVAKFWSDWQVIHDHITQVIQNKAMIAQQRADPNQVELAATAFADGYMLRVNYLRAWYAYCGGMFNDATGGNQEPWTQIARAWFIGAYAGTAAPKFDKSVIITTNPTGGWIPYQPTLNLNASYPFANVYGSDMPLIIKSDTIPCDNTFKACDRKSVVQGRFGQTVLDISPPACKSDTRGDAISVAWRKMGTLAGDGAQFMQACASPHGVGQSDLSSNVWYRDRGMFQGACHGVPEVPVGTGYTLGNVSAYSPDNKTIIFTKVG